MTRLQIRTGQTDCSDTEKPLTTILTLCIVYTLVYLFIVILIVNLISGCGAAAEAGYTK